MNFWSTFLFLTQTAVICEVPKMFSQKFKFNFGSKIISELKSNATGMDNINIKMIRLCCSTIIPHLLHSMNYGIECS